MQKAVETSAASSSNDKDSGDGSNSGGGGEAVDMGDLAPDPGTPLRAVNALLPFASIVAATLAGMTLDGRAALLAKVCFLFSPQRGAVRMESYSMSALVLIAYSFI